MAHSNTVPESLMAALHQQFRDPDLVELSFLIGYPASTSY